MENTEIEKNKENKTIEENDTTNMESNAILSKTEIEQKSQQDLIKKHYINLQKQKCERFIEIVMNQTTYTREEAISGLEKHNGDITLVIKEFLGAVDNSEERVKQQNSKSLHQKRYDIIREYMDNASTNFMKQQERAKKYNEFLERQKKAQETKEAQDADKNNSL